MDNKVIGINLSQNDLERYEKAAGMPLTKWFRMLAERECARHFLFVEFPQMPEYDRCLPDSQNS